MMTKAARCAVWVLLLTSFTFLAAGCAWFEKDSNAQPTPEPAQASQAGTPASPPPPPESVGPLL